MLHLVIVAWTLLSWFMLNTGSTSASASAPRASGISPPCKPGAHPTHNAFCYPLDHFPQAARGLPFSAANPVGIVSRVTHLAGGVVAVQRVMYPAPRAAAVPLGPPQSIQTFLRSADTASFVRIDQYQLSQVGQPRLRQIGSSGQWVFTADVPRQHMTIQVEFDGPKAQVSVIGNALFAAESQLPPKPKAPARVYVVPPHALHVGVPATFWVLVAPRWGTYPTPAFDFDFSLGGSWSIPVTETPDGSQACGGDNVAGQPSRRRGRWVFTWGDCPELGLTLTPRSTGIHSLSIYGYRVPLTAKGFLDFKHEKPAPGSGYRWQGDVSA